MAVKKPAASSARLAETIQLARDLALASISVGFAINTPAAARGFVQAAREMFSELDHATPLPEKAKAPTGRGGRPGNTGGMGAPDDLLGELET